MKELKTVKLLKEKGVNYTLNQLNPIEQTTIHIREKRKTPNFLSFFLALLLSFFNNVFNLLRSKDINFKTNYSLLFYVPNQKYERFLTVIKDNITVTYLIISDSCLSAESLQLRNIKAHGGFLFIYKETEALFKIYLYFLFTKRKSFGNFLNKFYEIRHLIRTELFLKYIFDHIKFNNYFSFHPNGITHTLIEKFYNSSFKKTYAIRPTTTSYSNEHKYILTSNLFYKSIHEKEIYEHFNLKNINLLEGGIILSREDNINSLHKRKKILFLDTTTNKSIESNLIRKKGISAVYSVLLKNKHDIIHKFHPGLLKSEKNITEKFLEMNNVPIVDNLDHHFDQIKIVVSYYSTLLYDFILKGVPVLLLEGEFSNIPITKCEFDEAPIIRSEKKSNFEIDFKLLDNNDNYSENLRKWFVNFHNYPKGIENIITLINQ